MRSKVTAIMMAAAVLGSFSSVAMANCGSCGAEGEKHRHGKRDSECAVKKTDTACTEKKSCPVAGKCGKAKDCKEAKNCPVAKKQCPDYKPQTTCPVMGGKVDKEQYVDVEGYRVYVCCAGCKSKIKASPNEYIEKIKENDETPLKLGWLKDKKCDEQPAALKDGQKRCAPRTADADRNVRRKA